MKPKLIRLHDKFQNEIIVNGDDIFIRFKSESRSRKVGTLIRKERVLFVTRNRSLHLLRVNQSYGFNHHILSTGKAFDKVRLCDEYGTYDIPVQVILSEGSFLHFKAKGFERQIFLPLLNILGYRIKSVVHG